MKRAPLSPLTAIVTLTLCYICLIQPAAAQDACDLLETHCRAKCGNPLIFPFRETCQTFGLSNSIRYCKTSWNCTCSPSEIGLTAHSDLIATTGGSCESDPCSYNWRTLVKGSTKWCAGCGNNCAAGVPASPEDGFQESCISQSGLCVTSAACGALSMCSQWRDEYCCKPDSPYDCDGCDAPTPIPTPEPTSQPTPRPTSQPTLQPTPRPTPQPTTRPECVPCLDGFGFKGSAEWCSCCANDCLNSKQSCIANDGFCSTRCLVAEYGCTPMPTPNPTPNPTPEPTPMPTSQPTNQPTSQPTNQPTHEPTSFPTSMPTREPTPEPTPNPTPQPTVQPTHQPTHQPTLNPTPQPTPQPTPVPTGLPTANPTAPTCGTCTALNSDQSACEPTCNEVTGCVEAFCGVGVSCTSYVSGWGGVGNTTCYSFASDGARKCRYRGGCALATELQYCFGEGAPALKTLATCGDFRCKRPGSCVPLTPEATSDDLADVCYVNWESAGCGESQGCSPAGLCEVRPTTAAPTGVPPTPGPTVDPTVPTAPPTGPGGFDPAACEAAVGVCRVSGVAVQPEEVTIPLGSSSISVPPGTWEPNSGSADTLVLLLEEIATSAGQRSAGIESSVVLSASLSRAASFRDEVTVCFDADRDASRGDLCLASTQDIRAPEWTCEPGELVEAASSADQLCGTSDHFTFFALGSRDALTGTGTPATDAPSTMSNAMGVPSGGEDGGLDSATLAGIVIGVIALLLLCCIGTYLVVRTRQRRRRNVVFMPGAGDEPDSEVMVQFDPDTGDAIVVPSKPGSRINLHGSTGSGAAARRPTGGSSGIFVDDDAAGRVDRPRRMTSDRREINTMMREGVAHRLGVAPGDVEASADISEATQEKLAAKLTAMAEREEARRALGEGVSARRSSVQSQRSSRRAAKMARLRQAREDAARAQAELAAAEASAAADASEVSARRPAPAVPARVPPASSDDASATEYAPVPAKKRRSSRRVVKAEPIAREEVLSGSASSGDSEQRDGGAEGGDRLGKLSSLAVPGRTRAQLMRQTFSEATAKSSRD
eukprot:CAMPEP_0170731348 /NCGR_PEP_ID=MMETSP0437-20130122/998_1 /TAXON_ID=0 /ORGANISM="Sexangularia sp." /LENGTH=1051 /DNA_ID=CAMNT_0011069567 /DNA_START=86 /DNA_END=3241 /DNA_ORIENTATION=+